MRAPEYLFPDPSIEMSDTMRKGGKTSALGTQSISPWPVADGNLNVWAEAREAESRTQKVYMHYHRGDALSFGLAGRCSIHIFLSFFLSYLILQSPNRVETPNCPCATIPLSSSTL